MYAQDWNLHTWNTSINLIFPAIMTKIYRNLPTITLKSQVRDSSPHSNKDTLPMYMYISSTRVSMTSRIERYVDGNDNFKLTSVNSALPCYNPNGGVTIGTTVHTCTLWALWHPSQVIKSLFQSFEIINQANGTLWLLRAVT